MAIPFGNPILLDKVKVRTEVIIVAMVFAMVVFEAEYVRVEDLTAE